MKHILITALSILYCNAILFAQIENVPNSNKFSNLTEALQNTEKVISLDLSNQTVLLKDINWEVFINLEYLSLKNDHLTSIPEGIAKLTKLKILDLSGNDFKTLPNTLKGLSKLEVLYLNDEKDFDLKQNMDIISNMTSLRELHLENNNLKALPNKIEKLKNLELLNLNNNKFIELPKQVMSLEHLQYLDLKDNNINPNIPELNNVNFGFKINLK